MPRSHALLVSALFVCTSTLPAAEHAKGAADLDAAGKRHIKVTVGDRMKFESDFYRFEFGGMTSVAANGTMTNTSSEKLHASLYIAFFDKDKNLIAAAGRTFYAVAPGKREVVAYPLGLPADVAGKVASYQITLYEGEKQVGQK